MLFLLTLRISTYSKIKNMFIYEYGTSYYTNLFFFVRNKTNNCKPGFWFQFHWLVAGGLLLSPCIDFWVTAASDLRAAMVFDVPHYSHVMFGSGGGYGTCVLQSSFVTVLLFGVARGRGCSRRFKICFGELGVQEGETNL